MHAKHYLGETHTLAYQKIREQVSGNRLINAIWYIFSQVQVHGRTYMYNKIRPPKYNKLKDKNSMAGQYG